MVMSFQFPLLQMSAEANLNLNSLLNNIPLMVILNVFHWFLESSTCIGKSACKMYRITKLPK